MRSFDIKQKIVVCMKVGKNAGWGESAVLCPNFKHTRVHEATRHASHRLGNYIYFAYNMLHGPNNVHWTGRSWKWPLIHISLS